MPHLVVTKQLKALILTKDISESGVVVKQPDCLTLQHFSYQCSRKRSSSGIPYGPTIPSYLDFTVRVAAKDQGKVFFERAALDKSFHYSFLFNASFNDSKKKLSDYEGAMVVTGYIVEMEEFFDAPREDSYDEQMLLHCRLLLCSIAYQGKEEGLNLIITED